MSANRTFDRVSRYQNLLDASLRWHDKASFYLRYGERVHLFSLSVLISPFYQVQYHRLDFDKQMNQSSSSIPRKYTE